MANSTLYPPNHQQLSDRVIRDIIVRDRRQSLRASNELAQPASAQPDSKRSSSSLTSFDTEDTKMTTPAPPNKHTKKEGAEGKLARRRERNKLHQRRYKKKQRNQIQSLEDSIEQLKEETQDLEFHRQLVVLDGQRNKSRWNVVAEYFSLFRFGVQVHVQVGLDRQCPYDTEVQRNFLRSTMAQDVTYGQVCGPDAVLENWRKMSLYHSRMNIELVYLENGPADSLIATIKEMVTVNENMIRLAFPHLISDEGSEHSQLAHRLLGQQFVVHSSVRFEWNEELNLVKSLQFKADILTPLLRVLGSLEDVSRVFDNALLTPEGGLVAEL